MMGLGKPSSILQWDQTNSFAQQNYLKNLYEPIVTFQYHFEDRLLTNFEDVLNIKSDVSFGKL